MILWLYYENHNIVKVSTVQHLNKVEWATCDNLSTYLREATIKLYSKIKLETSNNNINTLPPEPVESSSSFFQGRYS